jgi:23S rRNA-/tRNA-specific pseudouridylate synthase
VAFLARRFTYFTADDWRRQIGKGLVHVNGEVLAAPDQLLKQQDRLFYEPPRELEPEVDGDFVVHADDPCLIVVSKSGNIPVGEGGRYSRNVLTRVVPEVLHAKVTAEHAEAQPMEAAVPEQLPGEPKSVGSAGDEEPAGRGGLPPQMHAVHRLDKETSGLVVMAKHRDAAARLGEQFALHSITAAGVAPGGGSGPSTAPVAPAAMLAPPPEPAAKRYDVLLVGDLRAVADGPGRKWSGEGPDRMLVVEASIGNSAAAAAASAFAVAGATPVEGGEPTPALKATAEDPLAKLRMACFVPAEGNDPTPEMQRAKAKVAKSSFKVMDVLKVPGTSVMLTVAQVELFTGRTHQIRLHAAWCGCPVAGDKLYVAGGGTVDVATYIARARGEAVVSLWDQHTSLAAKDTGDETDTKAALQECVLKRHLLHSAMLRFTHPATRERVSFEDAGMPRFKVEHPWISRLQTAS